MYNVPSYSMLIGWFFNQDDYLDDDLDLNKTLPRNFRLNPPPMEEPVVQEVSNGVPKRSISTQHISSNSNANTIGSLSRIHPVASPGSSLTNLATIGAELRKSDPSLHRKKANVRTCCHQH